MRESEPLLADLRDRVTMEAVHAGLVALVDAAARSAKRHEAREIAAPREVRTDGDDR